MELTTESKVNALTVKVAEMSVKLDTLTKGVERISDSIEGLIDKDGKRAIGFAVFEYYCQEHSE